MNPEPILAAALSETEEAHFFPGSLADRLAKMIPKDHVYRTPGGGVGAWQGFLDRTQPQVLLSHWSTPRLPEAAFSHVKYLCHVTGGVRHIIPRSFVEGGGRLSNWGDGAAETVAESTLMLALSALRQTQYWGRQISHHKGWKSGLLKARTLFDRPVAIHGFGRIARALRELLRPFRVPVTVFSAGVPHDYIRRHDCVPAESLDALCASGADVFFELEALTPETRGSVGAAQIALLKPGSVFANGGRGAVVEEGALIRASGEKDLQLALDVFINEPLPPDSPLRSMEYATLMPHQGGPTPDLYPKIGAMALDNLERYLSGKPLLTEMSAVDYDRST